MSTITFRRRAEDESTTDLPCIHRTTGGVYAVGDNRAALVNHRAGFARDNRYIVIHVATGLMMMRPIYTVLTRAEAIEFSQFSEDVGLFDPVTGEVIDERRVGSLLKLREWEPGAKA